MDYARSYLPGRRPGPEQMGTLPRSGTNARAVALSQLHTVIQESFGWLGYHLHSFEIDGVDYGPDDHDDDDGLPRLDENRFDLATVAPAGSQFVYTYDFGDDWRHHIDIEDVVAIEPGAKYPRCLAGSRSRPPEDVGGPPGYDDFLFHAIVGEPDHDEEEVLEPAGSFDPAEFDLTETNEAFRPI